MFEKEAEEWVKENMDCCKTDNSVNQSIPYFSEEERCCAKSAFKDGAEFGYNKANEWHDINDKEPSKEQLGKQLLIKMKSVVGDTDYDYLVYKHNGESIKDVPDVIAWCEIPTFDKEVTK